MRTALLMMLLLPLMSLADGRSVSKYDVIAKGLRVGRIQTIRERMERDGRPLLRCEVATEIKVNLLLYRYSHSSVEVTVSDTNGIVEYERIETEDGRTREAHGALRDGVFHFEVVEDGTASTVDIPRASYEYATVDAPEQWLDKTGETRTFQILSVDKLSVVERNYTLVKVESINVNGQRTECRVVEFSDPFKSARRWFTMDALGLCIMRQDGKDKAGAYSLRMTSNETAPIPIALAHPL